MKFSSLRLNSSETEASLPWCVSRFHDAFGPSVAGDSRRSMFDNHGRSPHSSSNLNWSERRRLIADHEECCKGFEAEIEKETPVYLR